MSKLSRSVLKEIVKECIVEIFQESFLQPGSVIVNESKKSVKKNKLARPKRNILESDSRMVKNESFDNKINKIASSITSDPVFADIFRDTANTTLQSQMGAESPNGMRVLAGRVDEATKIAQESDPVEMFGESANKWAALAFSDPVNK